MRTLIGVGTGLCGASAIAAVAPVIGAVSIDVAYAISTICLFNVAAVLLLPVLGHIHGLSKHAFVLFAGTAVNDMSSVVATATTYGPAAARFAVVVKLVRTLMIVPIALGLSAWVGRKGALHYGGVAGWFGSWREVAARRSGRMMVSAAGLTHGSFDVSRCGGGLS